MEKDIASLQHTTYTLDSLLRTSLRPKLFFVFIDKTSRYKIIAALLRTAKRRDNRLSAEFQNAESSADQPQRDQQQ